MRLRFPPALALLAAASFLPAVAAGASPPPRYGATCDAAWTGKHGTASYRAYKKGCVAAGVTAAQGARSADDPEDAAADATRAVAACKAQFPALRGRKTLRAPYRACVAAAVEAQKQYGGRPLAATLAGEAGNPATDQDGGGSATLTLNQGHGQVCYDVVWHGLGVVTGVDIQPTADDSIVVPLDADSVFTDGDAKGCVNGVAGKLVQAIRQDPGAYSMNVRTDEFPVGAIRGALHA
jgi:hypothetical protein